MLLVFLLALSILTNAFPAAIEDPSATNASLLWGPFRPNLYMGIRPRLPGSLLMGLMWSNVDDLSGIYKSTLVKKLHLQGNFD